MTLDQARAIPTSTDEFDAAVDQLSDAAAAGDKDAAKVLLFMLQRNDDAVASRRR